MCCCVIQKPPGSVLVFMVRVKEAAISLLLWRIVLTSLCHWRPAHYTLVDCFLGLQEVYPPILEYVSYQGISYTHLTTGHSIPRAAHVSGCHLSHPCVHRMSLVHCIVRGKCPYKVRPNSFQRPKQAIQAGAPWCGLSFYTHFIPTPSWEIPNDQFIKEEEIQA